MFCPKCGAEYKEEFKECADCQVRLVKELPPERKPEPDYLYRDLVTVFATWSAPALAVAKSILQTAKIEYFVKGEMFPYKGVPVELQVGKDDEEEARKLLEALNKGSSEAPG